MNIPQCPNCGGTRVQYRYSMSTTMGFVPVIDNGILEDCDPNYHTSFYTCCKCHHNFYIREQYGKVIDVVDEGEIKEIPIEKMPISVSDNITAATASTLTINTDKNENEAQIKYQWQIDIEDLQRQMKEVKEALQRLEVSMSNGHSDLVETTQM